MMTTIYTKDKYGLSQVTSSVLNNRFQYYNIIDNLILLKLPKLFNHFVCLFFNNNNNNIIINLERSTF